MSIEHGGPPSGATGEPLRDRMRAALRVAMKAGDRVAVGALRATLGAIDNAEAVPATPTVDGGLAIERSPLGVGAAEVARRELSEDDVAGIVRDAVAEREEAARGYERAGRPERAERLRGEAAVLSTYVSGGR